MKKIAYCRYCKNNQEMEIEQKIMLDDETEMYERYYWCECPLCGSRSPISNTKEGALEYAVNGYA